MAATMTSGNNKMHVRIETAREVGFNLPVDICQRCNMEY